MAKKLILTLFILVFLGACDVFDDDNDDDTAATQPPMPPANTMSISVDLEPALVIGGGVADGSASAELVLDLDDGTLTGVVTLLDISADSVVLNFGFAGMAGTLRTALDQDSDTAWSVPGGTVLDDTDRAQLMSGGMHLLVTTADNPDGALRGQIITGDTVLLKTMLDGAQEVPPVPTMATALAFLTIDTGSGSIVAHVNTVNADDAVAAHIHQQAAGVNGGVLIGLMQDTGNPAHWFSDAAVLTAADSEALAAGLLYFNVHTPDWPAGVIRGQIVPDGLEIEFTALSGDQVVIAGMAGVETEAKAVAATTLDTGAMILNVHLNTENLEDATSASLNIAPEGQNGPVLVSLTHDEDLDRHWFAENIALSADDIESLRSQSLYFTVSNPDWPDGIIRGQWLPDNSSATGPGDTFMVDSVNPATGAELTQFPGEITVSFNSEVATATVTTDTVELLASGGDGSFGDGNEMAMTPLVLNSTGSSLSIDTGSLAAPVDDVYRLRLLGSGATPITDSFGNVLDGDGNATPGGDFTSTFSVISDMPAIATFTFIQDNVFTPNCTFSGCHSGGSPAMGQNLTAGQAYSNIVNVPSAEVPGLMRIEPGNANNSYLIQKVEGTAAVGDRMPLGRPALSAELIQALREWTDAGAENN